MFLDFAGERVSPLATGPLRVRSTSWTPCTAAAATPGAWQRATSLQQASS